MPQRVFGQIANVPVGSTFANRSALATAGVHRPLMNGISGGERDGADSIVLSGGYEDDADEGDLIVYTGEGARDPNTGKQIADQTLTGGNLALAVSQIHGLPVRVSRGAGHKSPFSPKSGYRYDGLFRVEDHWRGKGKSGFYVWRYRLVTAEDAQAATEEKVTTGPAERAPAIILRIVRDSKHSRTVKEIYKYKCQVCGLSLKTPAGIYAEGAHIRPLGKPHDGPDTTSNILCLCPNHHVLFDVHAFSVGDNFELMGLQGTLRIQRNHKIEVSHLRYHRELYLSASVKKTSRKQAEKR